MTTLSLKPNSRKTPPLIISKSKSKSKSDEWNINDVGVMTHISGFTIQFFHKDECEITNIPNDLPLASVRELTNKAMQLRKRQVR